MGDNRKTTLSPVLIDLVGRRGKRNGGKEWESCGVCMCVCARVRVRPGSERPPFFPRYVLSRRQTLPQLRRFRPLRVGPQDYSCTLEKRRRLYRLR